MSALSFILSLIKIKMHQSGSISLIMVPIIVISFRRGCLAGIYTGAITGTIKLFFAEIFHPLSAILDYILAYGVVGLAGLFKRSKIDSEKGIFFRIIFGTSLGCFARFVTHVLSGVVIFSDCAPVNQIKNIWLYSLTYNASYLFPEFTVTVFAIFFLKKYAKSIFLIK
jgi:thiamine transporter